MKLDLVPEAIPAGMRENYLQLIGASDAAHLEASMRPGCTHIVATALTQVPPPVVCGKKSRKMILRIAEDGRTVQRGVPAVAAVLN